MLLSGATESLRAQEVRFIDLSTVRQRTELRHPPAQPAECDDGHCIAGGVGGGSVGDGVSDQGDPLALGVFLVSVSPTDLDPSEPFEAEFKILNTGRAPIVVPVSPHLSDLQPIDESEPFTYFSLMLVVRIQTERRVLTSPGIGFAELYGSSDHDGTMLKLNPGDWIRVRARIELNASSLESVPAILRGEFHLRKNVYRPQPGGAFREVHNLNPNSAVGPTIEVRLVRRDRSDRPKH